MIRIIYRMVESPSDKSDWYLSEFSTIKEAEICFNLDWGEDSFKGYEIAFLIATEGHIDAAMADINSKPYTGEKLSTYEIYGKGEVLKSHYC